MCSCSIFSKGTVIRAGEGDEKQEAQADASPTLEPSQAAQATKNENKPAKAGPLLSALAGKLSGEWTIIQAGKHKIEQDEDMPYICFEESTGKFYASNGCNILNGQFQTPSETSMTFSQVISTMMSCPDLEYPSTIDKALRDGNTVSISFETHGKETYCYFKGSNGDTLLTLRRHNMEQLNGQWEVSEIEGKKIHLPEVNIFFDIPELSVHGNTGCNYFNGEILIEPGISNSISFSQMAVTMRACPNSDIERRFLVALEQVTTYSFSGKTLRLLTDNNRTLIVLKRK